MSILSYITKVRLSPRKILFALLTIALVLIVIGGILLKNSQDGKTALAASCTWTGDISGDFSDSGNWSGCGGVPQNGDDVTFPNSATTYTLNNDISGLSLNTVTVEGLNNQSYTLSGNNLDITYGITLGSGSNDFIFDTNVTTCRTEGDGSITINSGVTYTSGCDYINYNYSGDIHGSGTFVKDGVWNLTFYGNRTIDAAFVQAHGTTFTDWSANLTLNNTVTFNSGGIWNLGILNVPNYPIDINADGLYQSPGTINAYGVNFNGGSNNFYGTWNNNKTTVSGSDLNLNNVTLQMSYFGVNPGDKRTLIETTNGYTISGEFSNLPSGGTSFFQNGSDTVEVKANYYSTYVEVEVVSKVSNDCTWTGNDISGNWSNPNNWSGCSGGVPVDGKNIIFPDTANLYDSNNDISGLTLNEVRIDGGSYSLSGYGFAVSTKVAFNNTSSAFTLNSDISPCGITGSGILAIDGGHTVTVGCTNNTWIFEGTINGSGGSISNTSNGVQVFRNANIGPNISIEVNTPFIQLADNTTVEGTLNNYTGGGLLIAQSSNVSISNLNGNGGNVNFYPIGSGYPSQINNASFNSNGGNLGFDTNSTVDYGQVNFTNGVDLSSATLSARFFNTYNVGDSFTIINSSNGNITGNFSNVSNGGTLTGEGWGASSIVSNVTYSVTYNPSNVVITITNISPLTCSGNLVYTNTTGTVSSGTNNYSANSNCNWVIAPTNGATVTLNFTAFDTESGNDEVKVYDGITTSGTLLGTFSGNSIPSNITANSGSMLVVFTSNATTQASGFTSNWTSTLLPGPSISSLGTTSGPVAGGTNVTVNGTNFVSGQYQDINSIGGTGLDGIRGMVVDGNGNQYIAGEFSGSVTFGGTTLISTGSQDIFVAKINPDRTYAWAVRAGGSTVDGFTRRQSLKLNNTDGSLVIAGYYTGSATFGGTTLDGGSGANIFLAKLNQSNGTFVWAKSAGGITSNIFDSSQFPIQYGSSIDVDGSGNIYFSGTISGNNPTFGNINLTYNNSSNGNAIGEPYIAKADSSGNFLWVRNYATTTSNGILNKANGVKVDSNGNVYAALNFSYSMVVGGTTLTTQEPGNLSNSALIKLDNNGNPQWGVVGGSSTTNIGSNDLPYDVGLDSNEDVYITGYFGAPTATFGSFTVYGSPSGSTVYTAKLNPSGTFLWAKGMPSPGFATSRTMYIDSSDKIWIAGGYDNILTDGTQTITGNSTNAFFAQYDTSGNLIELKGISGTGGQLAVTGVGGNQVRALSVYNGNLYIAGEYFTTIGIGAQTITSAGNQDGFFTTWVIDKTSVKIDGIEVIANYISPTQLTFTTPPDSKGFKDVVVTNSDGRSFTLAGSYEYTAPEISNNEISSLVCSPSSTAINTTVNCIITTTVDINTLSGSVNVRIGLSGTPVNCPVGASGTTISCNNVTVGGTAATLRSQFNASGSGSTYSDGNNITVTNNNSNGSSCTGTNSSSNIPGQTTTSVCVESGALTLYAGDSTKNNDICTVANILAGTVVDTTVSGQSASSVTCSPDENSIALSGVTTGSKRQFATATIDDIIFEDLRGYDLSDYTVTATVSNFVDPNDSNKKIDLGSNPDSENNETDADRPSQEVDKNKIYGVIDPSGATITPLRSATTIAYGTNNYIRGSKVSLIDNVTQVTLLSTSAPTKTGRISIDNVIFKLRIPSFVPAGNFKGTIVETVI